MKIEQRDLFRSSLEAEKPIMAGKSKTTSSYKNPPNTTLLGGLDEATLKSESVYLLRVLTGQYIRAFPNAEAKKKFMHTVQAEMKLKQGTLEATMLLRDSLLKRNIQYFTLRSFLFLKGGNLNLQKFQVHRAIDKYLPQGNIGMDL